MKKKTLWGNGAADKQQKAQEGSGDSSKPVNVTGQQSTAENVRTLGNVAKGATNRPGQMPGRAQGTGDRPAQVHGGTPSSPVSVPEEATGGALGQPTTPNDWRWADCDWGFVLKNQSWGTILLILLPIVLALAAMFTVDPTEHAFDVDDPTISREAKPASIPTWAIVLIPFGLFLLALFTGELWLYRPLHGCLTNALFSTIHFIVGWGTAMAIGSFTWWVTTLVVGRLRPDFLSRCNIVDGECTTEPHHGRQSFFSGPAMWSGLSAMYSTVYIFWLVYVRIQKELGTPAIVTMIARNRSLYLQRTLTKERKLEQDLVERLVHEIGHTLALYAILIQLGYSWASSVSLLVDNRNHPSDINAGLIVGMLVGGLFSLKFVWLWDIAPKKPMLVGQVSSIVQPLRSIQYSHVRNRSASPAMLTTLSQTGASIRPARQGSWGAIPQGL